MNLNSDGLFQTAYGTLSEHFCMSKLENKYSKEFASLSNNMARVEYLLTMPSAIKELLKFPTAKTEKSMTQAVSLKTEGNKHFQKKNLTAALASYNQALILAPFSNNDGLLAVCFANRSAVFFSLHKYEECLSDIDMAIKHNYPSNMLYKLMVRKAKCYQYRSPSVDELNKHIAVALNAIGNSTLDSDGKQLWESDVTKLSIKVHPPYSSPDHAVSVPVLNCKDGDSALSSCARICEDNEFGRFIQAAVDIQAGDVLLVEKPFCSVTLPDSYMTHCCCCQRRVNQTIYPCRACSDVVYCGATCEQEAWHQYHACECDYILNLKAVDVNMGHLALRSALKAGYETLSSLFGFGGNASTIVCDYENIFKLQGHEQERSNKDLFWRTVAAVVLAGMCDLSLWAGKGSEDAATLPVLATCILHHMDIFPCNAHEISEILYDDGEPCKSALVEIGAGIYETLSMFNHSCDPSVVRTFYEGNTCVMNALSPINRSEQVYDNYGCLYATHDAGSRTKELQSQYYFQCCCPACMGNWPLYHSLSYDDDPVYRCAHCDSMILPPFAKQCDACLADFDKDSVDQTLQKAKLEFDLILSGLFARAQSLSDLPELAQKLADYSQLVNSLVFRPYKTLNDCQEALKHVYALMGNMALKQ